MSRIEKAIEAATLKRSQERESRTVADPPVLLKSDGKRSTPQPIRENLQDVSNPFLVTANNVGSPAAEQYRKLKSLVVRLLQRGDVDKTLMVTSPVAGEGKTITSLNLAITMAQELDHTVLLVEADIRKPSVLRYLGMHAEKGLTDCVTDGLEISDVLVKTGLGGLSVLPAGSRVDNPVELFSSRRMIDLFAEIKSRDSDRYVIVDTTPLLPFAEPQYLASLVGAVLLVVREGVTTPEKLKRSLEILKDNNLLGVVSNGVSRVTSAEGYYGYYGSR